MQGSVSALVCLESGIRLALTLCLGRRLREIKSSVGVVMILGPRAHNIGICTKYVTVSREAATMKSKRTVDRGRYRNGARRSRINMTQCESEGLHRVRTVDRYKSRLRKKMVDYSREAVLLEGQGESSSAKIHLRSTIYIHHRAPNCIVRKYGEEEHRQWQ